MKLRLTERSVRLRVRRSEVELFSKTGCVSETLVFPGGAALTYRLTAAPVIETSVAFGGGVVEILVPAAQAAGWAASQQVGIYGQHRDVEICVEKDFRRTSLPSPDDGDRYPNPRASGAAGGD
ncbi:MAG TPA: hypothetical protein DEH78_03955 [Solibacterales bacterium]|nr:hypothetical protein [Bryobacterales bacterium]